MEQSIFEMINEQLRSEYLQEEINSFLPKAKISIEKNIVHVKYENGKVDTYEIKQRLYLEFIK